jgi:hypothetical protein
MCHHQSSPYLLRKFMVKGQLAHHMQYALLYFCSLFKDAFSVTQTIGVEWRDEKWMMNWKGFGRKLLWSNFKVLFRHLPGGTVENHEKSVSQGSRYPAEIWTRDPEYEVEVLTTLPRFCKLRTYKMDTMPLFWKFISSHLVWPQISYRKHHR